MKKSIQKAIVLTSIIMALYFGPIACENCAEVQPYFTITGLQVSNLKFKNTENMNPWSVLKENESVRWSDFFMRINFQAAYHAKSYTNGFNAYADCGYSGYRGSKTGLDTLYVITLKDYNSTFSAGDTINNITLYNNWTGNSDDYDRFYTLEEYTYKNKSSIQDRYFELKLSEAPNRFGEHQFKIVYVLTDVDKFETDAAIVNLGN